MKKGQIYIIESDIVDDKLESKQSGVCAGILMHDSEGPKVHPLPSVVVIPIVEIEPGNKPNGIEINPKLFEKDWGRGTGIALIDKIRTVDKNLIKKKLIGSINLEGLKLIDRAVLISMGVDLPEIDA